MSESFWERSGRSSSSSKSYSTCVSKNAFIDGPILQGLTYIDIDVFDFDGLAEEEKELH